MDILLSIFILANILQAVIITSMYKERRRLLEENSELREIMRSMQDNADHLFVGRKSKEG